MPFGLRTQLVLSFLFIALLAVVAVGWMASRFTEREFSIYVSETGRLEAQLLTPIFAEYYEQRGSWDDVGAYVTELDRSPWELLSNIGGAEGILWQDWENLTERDVLGLGQELADQVSWQLGLWVMVRWVRGGRVLLSDDQGIVVVDSGGDMVGEGLSRADLEKGASVVVDGRRVGTVVVAAGLGVENPQETAFLRRVNRGLLVIGLVAIVAALALGWWLAGRLTAPARALTAAARELASGNWEQQLPVRSRDEFGQMTTAFNEMATEITRQTALRRRLVADLAHELRTPLSVLRLELEATQDGLQSPQEAVAHLGEELGLLERLVEDLRLLARADAGELPLSLQPEDLGALVARVVERWKGRAGTRGLALVAQVSSDLPLVELDRLRINQVLTNLLSNALRHTPEGGRIEVRVRPAEEENALLVSVSDTGEGVAPDVLPYIFDRLYRPDLARSRETGGAGLGLSIARQAVELHGGCIWAESELGEGSTFFFTLPVSDTVRGAAQSIES